MHLSAQVICSKYIVIDEELKKYALLIFYLHRQSTQSMILYTEEHLIKIFRYILRFSN